MTGLSVSLSSWLRQLLWVPEVLLLKAPTHEVL